MSKFLVDIPVLDGDMQQVAEFDTKSEAIAWIREHLGMCDDDGNMQLLTDLSEDDEQISVPYYCQDCGHEGDEDDFIPSDGNPAPHVCPSCGMTNVFTKEKDDG